MLFKKDPKNMELTMAEMKSKYQNPELFRDPSKHNMTVQRFELDVPSWNYILSGRYFGPGSGAPIGKIYNVFGPSSIGKSAFALYLAGKMYQAGGTVHWIDKETSFDADYAKRAFGLDALAGDGRVSVSVPDNAEEAFNILVSIVENDAADLIVVDSVPALGTLAQNEKDAEKASMAELARKLSEHFPKIISKIYKNNITILYINQLRANISGGMAYGNKATGGNAMTFYSDIGLEFKRTQGYEIWSADKKDYLGHETIIEADKNKTAWPHLKAKMLFYPGEGFSRVMDIANLAIDTGVIKKSSAWLSFGEAKFQGMENMRMALKEDPELLNKIWEATKPLLHPVVNTNTGEILNEATTQSSETTGNTASSEVAKSSSKKKKNAA
jgi:recombination protein RecA